MEIGSNELNISGFIWTCSRLPILQGFCGLLFHTGTIYWGGDTSYNWKPPGSEDPWVNTQVPHLASLNSSVTAIHRWFTVLFVFSYTMVAWIFLMLQTILLLLRLCFRTGVVVVFGQFRKTLVSLSVHIFRLVVATFWPVSPRLSSGCLVSGEPEKLGCESSTSILVCTVSNRSFLQMQYCSPVPLRFQSCGSIMSKWAPWKCSKSTTWWTAHRRRLMYWNILLYARPRDFQWRL